MRTLTHKQHEHKQKKAQAIDPQSPYNQCRDEKRGHRRQRGCRKDAWPSAFI